MLGGLGIAGFAGYQALESSGGIGRQLPLVGVDEQQPSAGDPNIPIPPDNGYRLVIEKIGVDAPVREEGLDENAVPVVPIDSEAGRVAIWYNFSAPPGSGDNAVFAGHVTWNGDAVFKHLADVAPGDRVVVRAPDSSLLIYEVSQTTLIYPDDPTATSWMAPTGTDAITIITCGGEYRDTDDIFGGAYDQRYVVRAELVARG